MRIHPLLTSLPLTHHSGLTWRPTPAPEEQAFGATEVVYGNGAILWSGRQI